MACIIGQWVYDNSYLSSVNTPISSPEANLMGESAVEMYNVNYANFKLLNKKI